MMLKNKFQTDIHTDEIRDAGLRKAVKTAGCGKLPSNFGYVMMRKINQEAWKKERRAEKRLLVSIIIACILMLGTAAVIAWCYFGTEISAALGRISTWVSGMTDEVFLKNALFCLPTLVSLFLIYLFHRWLRTRFGYLLK